MSENDEPDNGAELPDGWEGAPPFIVDFRRDVYQRFNEVDAHLDRADEDRAAQTVRIEKLEGETSTILSEVSGVKEELSAVSQGVARLHLIFQNVADRYASLVNLQGQQIIEQNERWKAYDDEQRAQGNLIRDGYKRLVREDRWRFSWRVSILCIAVVALFVAVIEKVH